MNGMMYIYFSISNYRYYIYRKFAYDEETEGIAIYYKNKLVADLECDSFIQFDNWGMIRKLNIPEENSELMDQYIAN